MTNSKYFLPVVCLLAAAVTAGIAFLVTQNLALPLQAGLISIFTCIAATVPWVMRNVRDRREMLLVEIQFVDFMCTIRMCIMAGLSLQQSILRANEGKDGILAGELFVCMSRVRMGQSTEESLNEFAQALPLRSVQEFVTSVNVLKETGGNIAETCDTLARTYRMGLVEHAKHNYARGRFAVQLAILTLFPPLVWQSLGFANIAPEVLVLIVGCALQFSLLAIGRSPRAVGYRGWARDWTYPVSTPAKENQFSSEPSDLGAFDSSVAEVSQFRGSDFLRGAAVAEAEVDSGEEFAAVDDVEPLWRTEFAPALERPDDELVLDMDSKKIWWNLQEAASLGKGIIVSCDEGIDAHKTFQRMMQVIPSTERVALVEAAKTMSLVHEFGIHLVARPSNAEGQGAVGVNQLIQAASNMNVRWLIVPESEHVDMLETMNQISRQSTAMLLGLRASNATSALATLDAQMGDKAALRSFRENVARNFAFIVQIRRLKNGAVRMVQLTSIEGLQGNEITQMDIFNWDNTLGETVSTGILPSIYEQFENQSMTVKKFYSN